MIKFRVKGCGGGLTVRNLRQGDVFQFVNTGRFSRDPRRLKSISIVNLNDGSAYDSIATDALLDEPVVRLTPDDLEIVDE